MSWKRLGLCILLVASAAGAAALHAQSRAGEFCACQIPDDPPNPHPYLVGHLGVYKNLDWVDVQDEVLPLFDIVNVMIYGSYELAVTDMAYWANVKRVPREKLTLGIGFHNFKTLLASYPNAWAVDTVGGGTYRDGEVITYQGERTVARQAQLSRQYGGAMIWELTQDDPASPHSLLKVIQRNLAPDAPPIPEPAPRRGGN